jgi:hypothetical protein
VSAWAVVLEARANTPSAVIADLLRPGGPPHGVGVGASYTIRDGRLRIRCRVDADTEELARRAVARLFGEHIEWVLGVTSVTPLG